MKRFLCLFSFLVFSMLMGNEIIKNGDLEKLNSNGRAEFWWGKVDPESGVEKGIAPGGKNALRVKNGGNGFLQELKVEGGNSYSVQYQLKSNFMNWLSAASVQILWYGRDGKPLFMDYEGKKVWNMKIKNLQGSRDWQDVKFICEAPKEATGATITLTIAFDVKNAVCWFAGLSMRKIEPADSFANRVASLPHLNEDLPESGFLNHSCWSRATVLGDFITPKIHSRAKDQTSGKVFYTDEAIYVALECRVKDADKIKISPLNTEIGMLESCEIFLLPPDSEKQMQILVTADGKAHVFFERWNDGNWPMKLEPVSSDEIKTEFSADSNAWRVAVKIPFTLFKRAVPLKDEEWRFNLCRAHYAGKEKELSAWSALADEHFQNPGDFGKIIFAKEKILVQAIHVNSNGAEATLQNTGDIPVDLELNLLAWKNNNPVIDDKSIQTLPPKSTSTITLKHPLPPENTLRFVEIKEGKRLVAKHNNTTSDKYLAFSVFDPEGVRTQTLSLAVDTPFFWAMSFRHNLDGDSIHKIIRREKTSFDLILQVPEEIRIRGMQFDGGGWMSSPLIKPSFTKKTVNGAAVSEYRFELPFLLNWSENAFLFFYECTLPEGKSMTGNYYFLENGVPLETHPLEFRTMKIGSMKRSLKRFTNDTFYLSPKTLRFIFPEKTLAHYKRLGMNRITFRTVAEKNPELYQGSDPKKDEDYDDLFFKEMKEDGEAFYFTSDSSSATPQAWSWTHNDKDARAVGSDGGDAPYNQYGYPSLCPSYRGKEFQNHVAMLTNSYLFKKYRCTWLTLDLELWPKAAWDKLCFCDRCLKVFRNQYPEFASADVRSLFRSGDKAFLEKWERFKEYQHAEFIRDLTNPVRESVKNAPSTNPRNRFLIEEWCSPKKHLFDVIDFFEVGFYFTPDVIYKRFLEEYEKWGDEKKFLYPTFTFGQTPGCPDFHMKEEQIQDILHEAAIFGSQGVCWYHYFNMEPRRMKYMIRGMNEIALVEDIVLDGRITDQISSDNPAVRTTSRTWKNEGLIVVRAYDSTDDQSAVLTLKGISNPCSVYDCFSEQKIADLSVKSSSFRIKVPGRHSLMLYVGTEEQWKNRTNQGDKK